MAENTEERIALDNFRSKAEKITGIPCEDEYLIRWLRARNLNVEKALEMLQASMEWREKEDIKGLASWPATEVIANDFIYKFTGEDAEGRPVLVVPFGKWEVRKLIEQGYKEDCFKYMHRLLEEMMVEINKRNKTVTQFVVILDSAELTFRKIAHLETINSTVQFFREFEANYPETLFACHIINAPWVFPYIFNIVKPLLSMRTLSKVQIYDNNGAKWKEILKENLPAKSYPQSYGGKAMDLY